LLSSSDDALLEFFKEDLLVRQVDLTKPTGLVKGDVFEDTTGWNSMLARTDGVYEAGLKVPGAATEEVPDGVRRFVAADEGILFTLEAPSGKDIRFDRKFDGSLEAVVEMKPGVFKKCTLELDGDEKTTGRVEYPTGKVIPGGFFVNGLLKLGSGNPLGGELDLNGSILTNGDFHFEGGCKIYIVGKTLAEARFIIDRRDGLYIHGNIDTGLVELHVEGRLSANSFDVTGRLDVRAGGCGIKLSVSINPHGMRIRGDVYVANRRIFSGNISVDKNGFKIGWSVKAGRLSVSADVSFGPHRNGKGKITGWGWRSGGKVKLKLPWPIGTKSWGFGFSLDSDGSFSVGFWKIRIRVNVAKFKISWEWD